MGPHRILQNRKGYVTETVFDAASGRFVDRPFPSPDTKMTHAPSRPAPSPTADAMRQTLASVETRMINAHASHLGYPYNLTQGAGTPPGLARFLINNLGDPYVGSHFASEVCDLEREVIDWMKLQWDCDDPASFWGSVGACGTEGNLWAMYLGREAFPKAMLIHSAEAHYSIPKAARILRIRAESVACTPDGAIDLDALSLVLGRQKLGHGVILALTCGTTVKGAHDDIAGAAAQLEAAGFSAQRRFVNVDGALNAMVLPFLDGVDPRQRPTFRHGIDSISTSGHKMIGCPMPCGILVARRSHVARVSRAVAYLRSDDTTLMGSRNGHAVLELWVRLFSHGAEGFRRDATTCLHRAHWLADALRMAGVPVLHNPHALTILFPEPEERIVRHYQLSCADGQAHAIVMPNVTQERVGSFAVDYLRWWTMLGAARGNAPARVSHMQNASVLARLD
jgi:histidine decarboxylase